jgi:hypothetical protein
MTHPVAHAIAKAALQHSVSPAVTVDYLPLNDNGTFTVNVKASNDGSLEFTSASTPDVTGTKGVDWKPVKPYPASTQITFVFVLGSAQITSLTANTSGLTFRPVSGSQQVGTVVGTAGTYGFTVNTSTGAPNAQIVVTPIGGGVGDGD